MIKPIHACSQGSIKCGGGQWWWGGGAPPPPHFTQDLISRYVKVKNFLGRMPHTLLNATIFHSSSSPPPPPPPPPLPLKPKILDGTLEPSIMHTWPLQIFIVRTILWHRKLIVYMQPGRIHNYCRLPYYNCGYNFMVILAR